MRRALSWRRKARARFRCWWTRSSRSSRTGSCDATIRSSWRSSSGPTSMASPCWPSTVVSNTSTPMARRWPGTRSVAFTRESISLQREASADPEGDRRARSDEGPVPQRELTADRGKRPGHEGAGVRESVRAELGASRVLPVEQVVDLEKDGDLRRRLIASPEIHDGVSGGAARPEIVDPVRLVRVVFVATRVRARGRDEAEIDVYIRPHSHFAERLEHVPRDEWHARTRLDLDLAFQSWV